MFSRILFYIVVLFTVVNVSSELTNGVRKSLKILDLKPTIELKQRREIEQ